MRFRSISALFLMTLLGPVHHSNRVDEIAPADPDDAVERWFLKQRAFPDSDIPSNARRAAFEAMQKQRTLHTDAAGSYNWQSLGPAPLTTRGTPRVANTGRVTAIAISPADSNLIVVGSSSGGIWRTTDGGSSFTPVSDDQIDLEVGSIAFAPSNPNVVYAGTGDDHLGTGVLKSTDAGATWRLVTTPSFPARSATKKILVDPTNQNVVWLLQGRVLTSTGSSVPGQSLLKSIDGGATWSSAFNGIVWDVLIPSGNGSTLLIGVVRAATFGTGGIYRTTDGGSTWDRVYSGPSDQDSPPHYCLAVASTGTLYAAAVESVNDVTGLRLMSSTDGGDNWTQRGDLPQDSRILYLAVSPYDDRLLYLGAVGGYRSSDGGMTWTRIEMHVDQHAIAFDPNDPSPVWLGNDGGLFRSSDRGATVESLAAMLPIVQFYSVNAHPTDPAMLFGGSQDNGLQRQDAGALQWTQMFGGDVGTQLFDRSDPSRILTNSIGANIVRCKDNCDNAQSITNSATFGESDENSRYSFLAPLTAGADGTVWFGTWRIFASRDFGTTWTAPAGTTDLTAGDDDVITAMGAAESDANVLYTGSAQGHLMVTHDAARTWTDITPPVGRYITSIAVSRTSPDTAYVAFSGYHAARIYKTTTSGATWTDAGGGLPDIPVNTVFIDKRQPETLYAGTDIGVFRSDTAGGNWYPFNSGMPPVIVMSFTVTADGRLIAGTYGRGAYVLATQEAPPAGQRRRTVRH